MAMMGGIIQGVSGKIDQRGQAMGQYKQEIQNEAIAKQNAALSREEAARVRREADLAEEAHRRVVIEELGRAFTAAAQSGARGGGGTTQDRLLKQEATLAELDALNIRYGGDLERTAHLSDAANYDLQAHFAHKNAGAIKKNMWVPLVGSALTAAASYGAAGGGGSGSGFNFGSNRRGETPKTHSKKPYGSNVYTRPRSNTSRSVGGNG